MAVTGAAVIVNGRGTSGAALYEAFPACEAVIVHEPAPVIVTVEPLTVQFPLEAKVTANPELAVADTTKGASPKILLVSAPKVIV